MIITRVAGQLLNCGDLAMGVVGGWWVVVRERIRRFSARLAKEKKNGVLDPASSILGLD